MWHQQDLFSYCWFLCGSSNDSFLAPGSCVMAARFFLTAGSCVAAAKLPIVGSCVTTIRYPFFLYAWSVGLEFEVDVHE